MPMTASIEDSSRASRRSMLLEPDVDDVLFSLQGPPYTRDDLRDFMKSEFNAENVDFWARAEEYRQVFGDAQAPKMVRVTAGLSKDHASVSKEITDTYLQTGAPHEVNISSGMRDQALRKVSEGDLEAFATPQQEVRNLIAADSFPRFIKRATNQNLTKSHADWRKRFGIKLFILALILMGGIFALELTDVLHTPFVRLAPWIVFVGGISYYISGRWRV
ncbi:Regulator of G-protein signaling 21 [Hondaea fermentalgiana]|uniref:Regulator of G-protein signaling 21 n=1 Tax=Hondaea fermentalgiana TaxID=2315210 RepID=A0A2R5GDX9_9STRA|nr:Regulator of G-protein signaling 21 [Hondaea fermentalgiana]|eukprot:GBG29140.1 Regulator of G-protein signaling 21 [Hondaea fermentalgiana]